MIMNSDKSGSQVLEMRKEKRKTATMLPDDVRSSPVLDRKFNIFTYNSCFFGVAFFILSESHWFSRNFAHDTSVLVVPLRSPGTTFGKSRFKPGLQTGVGARSAPQPTANAGCVSRTQSADIYDLSFRSSGSAVKL
jgi:hypothetical protein